MEQEQLNSHNKQDKSLIDAVLSEVLFNHESEIEALNHSVRTLILRIVQQLSFQLHSQFASLNQQIVTLLQQQADFHRVKEDILHDNHALTSQLQLQLGHQNCLQEEVGSLKLENQQYKGITLELQHQKVTLQGKLINQKIRASNLQTEHQTMSYYLEKERHQNREDQQKIQLLQFSIKQLNAQFESQQELNSKLNSSLSLKEDAIKELIQRIEDSQYIQSIAPQQFQNKKKHSVGGNSFESRKLLNQDQLNIRISQSEDPIYFVPSEKIKEVSTSQHYDHLGQHNLTSEKKHPKVIQKVCSVTEKKKVSNSVSNSGGLKARGSVKQREKSEGLKLKDRLKDIFTERVRYKIQLDQRYYHKLDSLRCRARARQIETLKIQEQLNGHKRGRKNHERIGSLVLGNRNSSRRVTKVGQTERWLDMDSKETSQNQHLNTSSYENLSDKNSRQQNSPESRKELYEFSDGQKRRKGSKDEFQDFNQNQNTIEHHLLNLEVDIRDDISFRHSENNNQSNSLSQLTHVSKRQRHMSTNSNQDGELYMYQGGQIRQEHSQGSCSPAINTKAISNNTPNHQSPQEHINQELNTRLEPFPNAEQQSVLMTSILNHDRPKKSELSKFEMIYCHPRKSLLTVASLGCLQNIKPRHKNLTTQRVCQQIQIPGGRLRTLKLCHKIIAMKPYRNSSEVVTIKTDKYTMTPSVSSIDITLGTQGWSQTIAEKYETSSTQFESAMRSVETQAGLKLSTDSQTSTETIDCLSTASNTQLVEQQQIGMQKDVYVQDCLTNTEVRKYTDTSSQQSPTVSQESCGSERISLTVSKLQFISMRPSQREFLQLSPTNTDMKSSIDTQSQQEAPTFQIQTVCQGTNTMSHNPSISSQTSHQFTDHKQTQTRQQQKSGVATSPVKGQNFVRTTNLQLLTLLNFTYPSHPKQNIHTEVVTENKQSPIQTEEEEWFSIKGSEQQGDVGDWGEVTGIVQNSQNSQENAPLSSRRTRSCSWQEKGFHPLPHHLEQITLKEDISFRQETALDSSRPKVKGFQYEDYVVSSPISSPLSEKRVATPEQIRLTQLDWNILGNIFHQLKCPQLLQELTFESDTPKPLPFCFDHLRVYFCSRQQQHCKFVLWRGKVIQIHSSTAFMELPRAKLASISHPNGNLFLGNSQFSVVNRRLTVSRSSKIRLFVGSMPEGRWFIDRISVYQGSSSRG